MQNIFVREGRFCLPSTKEAKYFVALLCRVWLVGDGGVGGGGVRREWKRRAEPIQ